MIPSQDAVKTGPPPEPARMGLWLVLAAAFLGWMFDGMEQGLFPMVARSALKDLLGTAASDAAVGEWTAYIMASFLLGAACGGVAFGWLGDRIGRVRAMALTILVYSGFIGACCFATQPWQLACLQFFAATGMGGEWALGVAIVVECWPDRLRPMLSGTIGSASNCGFLLVGSLGMMFPVTPDHWRWVVATCAAPAVLALFILGFVPESKHWQTRRVALGRAAARDLRRRHARRHRSLGDRPGLGGADRHLGLRHGVHALVGPAIGRRRQPLRQRKDHGGDGLGRHCGCLCAPVIAGKTGRHITYFAMCLCSLAVCQFLYRRLDSYGWPFLLTVGLTGFCTASFYGWFPLYLPELSTRVRRPPRD